MLFLPVFVEGAKFSARRRGHGVQGDGEVCVNALEICLTGTFTPKALHKNMSSGGVAPGGSGGRNAASRLPAGRRRRRIFISMGMHEDP